MSTRPRCFEITDTITDTHINWSAIRLFTGNESFPVRPIYQAIRPRQIHVRRDA
jgi:hypothetical protein